jgi:hypothetical protein
VPALVGGWLVAGAGFATAPPQRLADPAAVARARMAQGDAAWTRRAEGYRGELAEPGPIAAAVTAYEAALRLDPASLEVAYKLQQALWFQGEYATADAAVRRRLYARGRDVGERALDVLARRVGGRRRMDGLSVAEVARALRGERWAAPLFLTAACHWGLWAGTGGPMAAVREGALGKARRYTLVSLALDGRFLDGAGYRMLGMLNIRTPRVPLLSGWVDRDAGVAALRRAVDLFPHEPINRLFLAEAMVAVRAGDPEARALLHGLVNLEPRPQWLVEDVTTRRRAGELLAPGHGKH